MRQSSSSSMSLFMLLAMLCFPAPVLAHSGHEHSSFTAGLLHPIFGLDHLLAMVAVGLLSARLAMSRMWILPAVFVALMAGGGLLGYVWAGSHIALPAIEWGITLSVIVFALVVALWPGISLWVGGIMVGVFAVCHGHAHVAEMGDASAIGYFPGMLLATACLHLSGLAFGVFLHHKVGSWSLRTAGAAVACVFVGLMIGRTF